MITTKLQTAQRIYKYLRALRVDLLLVNING